MRWLTFGLLAGLALCMQTTLARSLAVFGAAPDFMFILLVHYALHGQTPRGVIAGWLLGLLTDLASVERLGMVSLVYGSAALAIWAVRDLMFVRHPLTHLFVTAASCFAVQLVLRGYHQLAYDSSAYVLGLVGVSLWAAFYTGLWAVVVHRALLKISRVLGLKRSRAMVFARRRGVRVV